LTNGILSISIPTALSDGNSVQLFNLTGKLVKEILLTGNNSKINLKTLNISRGSYIARINSGANSFSKNFSYKN